jgi:hypothetical protein
MYNFQRPTILFSIFQHGSEQAVIRTNEDMPAKMRCDRPAGSAHARIHNCKMDGSSRKERMARQRTIPPSIIFCGDTSWLISAICAPGQMFQITPFSTPTKPSLVPKSVLRVRKGIEYLSTPLSFSYFQYNLTSMLELVIG